jgi:hypothetical protein
MAIKTLPSIVTALIAALIAGAASAQTLTVTYPDTRSLSPRMSQLHGAPFVNGPTVVHAPLLPPQAQQHGPQADTAAQTTTGPLVNATGGASFDGMSVYQGGYIPSDNNIAVGPHHVVEVVNAAYAVYSKSGTPLLAPVPLKNLWNALAGSGCAANNGGDPIVVYDRAADRWMVTQLGSLAKPYSECIAVSQTGDPTGAFYLYSYAFGSNLNDYPKFGVWPTATNSAYLATYNLFANGTTFAGAEICAYDRAAMLAGAPNPAALCYTGINGASYLPVDLDGPTPPVDGTPGYFVALYGGSLGIYALKPDFTAATAALSPFGTIPVAGYTQAGSSPQPGTPRKLDALSDRLMYRLALRMFPDHEAMVVNHSVQSPQGGTGVRWYELRSPVSSNGAFSLYQQGTYAPDASYRWMGSAAMDASGNIALGYSVSNAKTIYPSLSFTARSPSDPLGTMQSEATLFAGSGSQTGYSRWGDYSSLRIDPADDCTFWYVNEYLPVTSSYGWFTRIASFRLANCGATPDFSLSADPTSLSTIQGSSTTSSIALSAIGGFASPVTLSVGSSCPTGATCAFSPNSISPGGTSLLTVAPVSTEVGTYVIDVTGTGGGLNHTINLGLVVSAPAEFTLNATPSSLTVKRGSKGSVTVAVVGSSGASVTLGVSGLPRNVSASFTPSPVVTTGGTTGGSATLTITTKKSTARGTYALAITGSSGGTTQTTPLTLIVN